MMIQVGNTAINMDQVTSIYFGFPGKVHIFTTAPLAEGYDTDVVLSGPDADAFRKWWDIEASVDVIG